MKELRFRCWINVDGEKFFGPGPAQLLSLIEQEGSITKAAKLMGMSYKKAWDLINNLNTKGNQPYVISQKAGQKGGGAALTETGKNIVCEYLKLMEKIETLIESEKEFLEHL